MKFGGEEAVKLTQKHDAIKTAFAQKHGFNLLRIKYTDFDRIEEILSEVLLNNSTNSTSNEALKTSPRKGQLTLF